MSITSNKAQDIFAEYIQHLYEAEARQLQTTVPNNSNLRQLFNSNYDNSIKHLEENTKKLVLDKAGPPYT